MKFFLTRTWVPVLVWLLFGAHGLASPPDVLSLPDLINRPDRLPGTVSLQRDFKFSNGATVHQGEKARVIYFDGNRVILVTPTNIRFNVAPADCKLLDAANLIWSALAPEQRAVEPNSLAGDLSLWPVRIKLTAPISCGLGKLPAGTEAALLNVSTKGTDIAWPNSPNRVMLDFGSTDVVERARQLVLLDPDKRPSRIAAALRGLLVDANGRPYQDEHGENKKIFAFYFGANWCAPCHAFSPDFVKFVGEALPRHPELAVVLMSNDPQPGPMLDYMQEEKMPFPAVPQKDLLQSSLLSSYAAKMIPHLIIVDRFGKVLASSDDSSGNRSDPKDTTVELGKLLAAQ